MRVAIFLFCCLGAMLLDSCAGPGAGTGQVRGRVAPAADSLPALPIDRGSSIAVNTQINGADFLMKSGSAAVDGTELELFSTLQDPSWGIWQLTPGNAQLVNVQALLTIPAGSEAWIAVANYSTGRWEISGPTESSMSVDLSDEENLSAAGNAHVAVIAAGGDSLNVVMLVLATDRVGWQYTVYDDNINSGVEPVVLEVEGRPAVAYMRTPPVGDPELRFAFSSSSLGIDQTDWTSVRVYQGKLELKLDAAIVSGHPAIVCRETDPERLLYFRSDTANGQFASDWPSPVTVDDAAGTGSNPSLVESGGKPAIAFRNVDLDGIFYARSSDAFGDQASDWFVVRTLQADEGDFLDISEVGGNPAVTYSDGPGALSYRRSAGVDGDGFEDWFGKVQLESVNYSLSDPVLLMAGGQPAVAYVAADPNTVLFRRSTTATGANPADWSELSALESAEIFGNAAAGIINGNPAVCYIITSGYEIIYRRSSTPAGTDGTWTYETVNPLQTAGLRSNPTIAEVAGRPVICWDSLLPIHGYYATYVE